jgi:hypothetical protein
MADGDVAPCAAADGGRHGDEGGKRRSPSGGGILVALVTASALAALSFCSAQRREQVRARAPRVAAAPLSRDAAPALPKAPRRLRSAAAPRRAVLCAAFCIGLASLLAPPPLLLRAGCAAAAMLVAMLVAMLFRPTRSQATTAIALTRTPPPAQPQASGKPCVAVTKDGRRTNVVGRIAVAAEPDCAWRVVKSCLQGNSPGVLRDVRSAALVERRSESTIVLAQVVRWQTGVGVRGINRLHAVVQSVRARAQPPRRGAAPRSVLTPPRCLHSATSGGSSTST